MNREPLRVGIMGAGAIGAYVGLRLSAAGATVVMVGRQRLLDRRSDLFATDLGGARFRPGADLWVTTRPEDLSGVELCLVAVKSLDTERAVAEAAPALAADVPLVSLQNGLRNEERLRRAWSGPCVPGLVTFNVVVDGAGYHQSTKGPIYTGLPDGSPGERVRRLAQWAEAGGLDLRARPDVREVMAGKLLINLGNGIDAALGTGWAGLLASRPARHCLSLCVQEGARVMRAAGLRPRSPVAAPLAALPLALRLPDVLVRPLARRLAGASESARSSTLQDLDRGRRTEIDDLNGEIVRLAADAGTEAPVNAAVVEIVHAHEASAIAGRAPAFLAPQDMLERLRSLA